MNKEQFRSDYESVRDKVLEAVFASDINPICCHEMAYLINTGLRARGYPALVENGVFKNMYHSWVIVEGSLGTLNGIIIDFSFHPLSRFFTPPIWHDRIVSGREKRKYKKGEIDFRLSNGVEELAKELFHQKNK